ncbi:MAG: hypothetical protein ACKVQT_37240 [Burkholderiales bacterium]
MDVRRGRIALAVVGAFVSAVAAAAGTANQGLEQNAATAFVSTAITAVVIVEPGATASFLDASLVTGDFEFAPATELAFSSAKAPQSLDSITQAFTAVRYQPAGGNDGAAVNSMTNIMPVPEPSNFIVLLLGLPLVIFAKMRSIRSLRGGMLG